MSKAVWSRVAYAMAGVMVGASLIGGAAWAGDQRVTSEDEDAFVVLRPAPGRTTGLGTAFLNQVQYHRGTVPTRNYVEGHLTFYGLVPRSTHVIYIAPGPCPGRRGPAFGSTMRVTTDALGGWSGDVRFNLGANETWVVKTFNYHMTVTLGSSVTSAVGACGVISDDANIE